MGWIGRGWQGAEDLWKITWVYGVFLLLLAKVAEIALRLTTAVNLENPTPLQAHIVLGLQYGWGIWWLRAAWKCAFNADWGVWGYMLRPAIVIFALMYCYIAVRLHMLTHPQDVLGVMFRLSKGLVHYIRHTHL